MARSKRQPTTEARALVATLERAASGTQPVVELLAAWSLVPAAEIADAIGRVPPPPELAEVTTSNAVDGLARLSRLDVRRDPRTSAALVRWLADPPWHATSAKPFYRLVFELLVVQGDPRAIAELASASRAVSKLVKGKTMRAWLVEQIGIARAALAVRYPDGVPQLAASERALAKRAGTAASADRRPQRVVSARTNAGAELLAAIRADPADDAARHVYADVLVEKGDPRGEFIVMQLARAGHDPTPEQASVEVELLWKHARVWLGELAGVIGSVARHNLAVGPGPSGSRVRFERGFLAGCQIAGSPAKLNALAGHGDLATVEELSVFRSRLVSERMATGRVADGHAIFLRETPMPALRALDLPVSLVEAALATPWASRLERIQINGRPSAVHVRVLDVMSGLREVTFRLFERELDPISRDVITAALANPMLTKLHVTFHQLAATFERATSWTVSFSDGRNAAIRTALAAFAAPRNCGASA